MFLFIQSNTWNGFQCFWMGKVGMTLFQFPYFFRLWSAISIRSSIIMSHLIIRSIKQISHDIINQFLVKLIPPFGHKIQPKVRDNNITTTIKKKSNPSLTRTCNLPLKNKHKKSEALALLLAVRASLWSNHYYISARLAVNLNNNMTSRCIGLCVDKFMPSM